jgi:hypothetical protein
MCIPPRSGQFLPSQFTQHLTANAYCVGAEKRLLDDSAQHRPENRPMPTLPTSRRRQRPRTACLRTT